MRASLLTGVSAAALALAHMTQPAGAADLPVAPMEPVMEPVIAPAFSWTGLYVGGHAGVALRDNERQDICDSIVSGRDKFGETLEPDELECETDNVPGVGEVKRFVDLGSDKVGVAFPDGDDDDDDDDFEFLAGGQIGYNAQYGRLVLGFEADASFLGFDDDDGKSDKFEVYDKVGFPSSDSQLVGKGEIESEFDMEWLATLRAHAGVALGSEGRLLLYGTGGLAFADIDTSLKGSFKEVGAGCDKCGFVEDDEDEDEIKVGFAVGAGAKYALTDNLSIGFKYLYVDFGEEEQELTFRGPASSTGSGQSELTFERELDLDMHVVRGEVNWKFSPAPAVAPEVVRKY
jgi:outer membrane immunogenic protein